MTSETLGRELRLARRLVAAGICLLLLLLGAAMMLLSRADAQQEAALLTRFDSRHEVAAHFIKAYVEGTLDREMTLAERVFTGPVDRAAFGRVSRDHGFAVAVLLDADGRLLASLPDNPAVVGLDLTAKYAHLRSAVAGVPQVSGSLRRRLLGSRWSGSRFPSALPPDGGSSAAASAWRTHHSRPSRGKPCPSAPASYCWWTPRA